MGMRKPRPRALRTRRHPIRRGWFRKRREQASSTSSSSSRDTVEAKRETSTPYRGGLRHVRPRHVDGWQRARRRVLGFRIFLFYVPYIFFFTFAFGLGADAADESASDLARPVAAWAPSLPKRSGARQTSRSDSHRHRRRDRLRGSSTGARAES